MRRLTLALFAALSLTVFARAADPKRAAGTETIPANGFAVVSVNVAQLWDAPALAGMKDGLLAKFNSEIVQKAMEHSGFDFADVERITVSIPYLNTKREPSFFIYITARRQFDLSKHLSKIQAVPIDEARKLDKTIPKEISGEGIFIREHRLLITLDDRTVVLPNTDQDRFTKWYAELKNRKPAPEGPLSEALTQSANHTLVAAVDVASIRKTLDGPGDLPVGLQPFLVLKPAERAIVTFDFGTKVSSAVRFTFVDGEAAQKAQRSGQAIFNCTRNSLAQAYHAEAKAFDPELMAVLDPINAFIDAVLKQGEVKLDGKVVTLSAGGSIDAAFKKSRDAFPAWAAAEALRLKTLNNLKQIGQAFFSYYDAFKHLPTDITDQDGKPILSWRVALLPYLEHNALYQKLDRTKPWNDPANQKFLEQMPDVFKVAGREPKEKGFTYFQSFTAAREINGGSPLLVAGLKRRISGITDGTSNTLSVVDGETAVNWLKPGDLVYDPKKLPKVGNEGWMFAAFLDGTSRRMRIPKDEVLKALITINGGESVSFDD